MPKYETDEQIKARWAKEDAKRRADYLKRVAKDDKELERYVAKLPVIPGYTGEWKSETAYYAGNYTYRSYVLFDPLREVRFIIQPGGVGTIEFNTKNGWRTFDRRGVEASFYWKSLYKGDKPRTFAQITVDAHERIAKQRDYQTTAISIPGIPFTVSPEGLTKLKEELKKRGCRSFMPSGFGTGYTLHTKRCTGCVAASKELVDFLGIGPIYITTFDAD